MTLHPLTPRQPVMLAIIVQTFVTVAIACGLFAAMMTVLPPVAWIGHLDEARDADIGFLVALMREYVGTAVLRGDPLGSVARLLDLPFAVASLLSTFGIAVPVGVRGVAALLVGTFIGLEAKQTVLADVLAEPQVFHVKGPRLVAGRAARRSLAAAWAKRFGVADPGVALAAGLAMPRALEAEHMLLVGGTGAGKTTVMETIMDGAIARGDRLLALDVKGDVTARFPSEDFCLLSLDDIRSHRWLLGLDIVTREDAAELATEIIRETSDPSWSGGARQVLTAILVRLQTEAGKRGKVWSWRQIDQILSKPVAELFAFLKESDPVAAALIDVTQDETRRQAMSFYYVLAANAARMAGAFAAMGMASGGKPAGDGVSIRRWASGKGSASLILRQSRRQPELSAAMCRIVLKIVADQAGSAPSVNGKAPAATWLFLDELPQIGRTPAVPRLAAIGRSLGVRIVAAIPSPAQLKEIYGADGAQHLIDNMTTKIVGRTAGGATASEFSASWIGNRTVSWMEETGQGSDGRPRLGRRTQDIAVADPDILATTLAFPWPPAATPGYGRSLSAMATWRCSPGLSGAGRYGVPPRSRVTGRTVLPGCENDQPRSGRLVGVARPDRG